MVDLDSHIRMGLGLILLGEVACTPAPRVIPPQITEKEKNEQATPTQASINPGSSRQALLQELWAESYTLKKNYADLRKINSKEEIFKKAREITSRKLTLLGFSKDSSDFFIISDQGYNLEESKDLIIASGMADMAISTSWSSYDRAHTRLNNQTVTSLSNLKDINFSMIDATPFIEPTHLAHFARTISLLREYGQPVPESWQIKTLASQPQSYNIETEEGVLIIDDYGEIISYADGLAGHLRAKKPQMLSKFLRLRDSLRANLGSTRPDTPTFVLAGLSFSDHESFDMALSHYLTNGWVARGNREYTKLLGFDIANVYLNQVYQGFKADLGFETLSNGRVWQEREYRAGQIVRVEDYNPEKPGIYLKVKDRFTAAVYDGDWVEILGDGTTFIDEKEMIASQYIPVIKRVWAPGGNGIIKADGAKEGEILQYFLGTPFRFN